ncbi:hypothetical protein NQZ68_017066 [Dissostichus eleginoides]|nr:hypothetical protein NQZ68_017066 [Dissostichus eleginoides]
MPATKKDLTHFPHIELPAQPCSAQSPHNVQGRVVVLVSWWDDLTFYPTLSSRPDQYHDSSLHYLLDALRKLI